MEKRAAAALPQVLQLDGLPAITALLGDATRGRGAVQQLATAALMGLTLDEAAKVAIVETAGKRLAELVNCAVRLRFMKA